MQIPVRRISKSAVNILVGAVAFQAIETTLTTTTELEENSIPVNFVAGAGSAIVTVTTRSKTDALVDKIADRMPKRKSRKTKTQTDPETL